MAKRKVMNAAQSHASPLLPPPLPPTPVVCDWLLAKIGLAQVTTNHRCYTDFCTVMSSVWNLGHLPQGIGRDVWFLWQCTMY